MATIIGTDGDDKYPYGTELRGTNGEDRIFGLAGDDALVGFDGNDVLEGGAGADELWGGYGFDYASYQGSPEGVYVLLTSADGTDFGDASGDRLYEVEGVVGSDYDDFLLGNDGDNVLHGGSGADVVGGLGGNDLLYGEGGDDRLEGGAGNDVLEGGAGSDTACFVLLGPGVVADLASGTAQGSYIGTDRLSGIENLLGSSSDDQLAGDKRANALEGGQGADVLEGRGGADQFVYSQTYDSRPAAADRILDFSHKQGDRIDLSGVDANDQVLGNQAFTFVGQNQFTAAGQVRWFQQDGDTYVEINTDNTDNTVPNAEMVIVVDPLVTPQAADFVL